MKPILRFLRSLQLSLVLLILLVPIIAVGNLISQQGRVPPSEIIAWDQNYPVLFVIADWCDQGCKANFHRPHPGKEALRYRIKAVREFLQKIGATA
jgi:hypothetical protein